MSSTNRPEWKNFLLKSQFYYNYMGLDPYRKEYNTNVFIDLLHLGLALVCFLNLSLSIVGETIYLFNALKSSATILQATALAPCLGFCCITAYKLTLLWLQRDTIKYFLTIMERKFPKTYPEIFVYQAKEYEEFTLRFQKYYCIVLTIAVWSFNLTAFMESFVRYYIIQDDKIFVYRFPFYVYYPFEINNNWVYAIINIQQIHAGTVSAYGTLAADLLMISMIMLCCMHFDFITNTIQNLKPDGSFYKLKKIIQYHQLVLKLSAIIDDVFSMAVLVNFIASSFIICLVGFQATAGVKIVELSIYLIFLIFELVQVWTLCYLGDKLISSSTAVVDAVYNNSFEGDTRHQKFMLLVLMRAQKPAVINAKSFTIVSLKSFSKVLSNSYQFFALLRTIYKP